MRQISRRAALKGGATVAAGAAVMTAATATAAIVGPADDELLALASEHQRWVEMDDRYDKAVQARMPAHLRHVDSREARRAELQAALQPDLLAIQEVIYSKDGAVRVRQKMAEIPATTLRGIHAKLQAADLSPGPYWATPRLVRTAAEDLERFIGEGVS